jgi:hypothetical protein
MLPPPTSTSGSLLVRTPRQGSWKLGSIPRQMTGGISSVGRAPALQAGCQEFESPILHEFYILTMSLISQADRQLALEAIEFYLFNKQYDFTEDKRMQLNALANWIRLESFKHEN